MTHSPAPAAPARQLRFLLVVACALVCLALISAPSTAADATIGIYTDPSGYSCSFNDNPGLVTAYIVIKPGTDAIRAVRFSAPLPSCFQATLLSESAPLPLSMIGSIETGVSVSSPYCETEPFYAMQLLYMSNGGTTACCEYAIVADPFTGALEAINCASASTALTSTVAQFNSNATCVCGTDYPAPNPPSDPTPADGEQFQSLSFALTWTSSDPSGLPMSCDVYIGTTPNPPLLVSGLQTSGITTYNVGPLPYNTTHYWRVVVRNAALKETAGPVWSFTTVATDPPPNLPPTVPASPSPPNGATNQPVTLTLSWQSSDPEGYPLSYDVYFSRFNPPTIYNRVETNSQEVILLRTNETYFWRIVARDAQQRETTGPLWTFTTAPEPDNPPVAPHTPSPANGAINVANASVGLVWHCSDPDGDALRYDVYFGVTSPPPLFFPDRISSSYSLGSLSFSTVFYWRIVARDENGNETSGPIWSFTTKPPNLPPNAPVAIYPSSGWTGLPINTRLEWQGSDPENQALVYDVYFGTTTNPPQVATNTSASTFDPGLLQVSTTYRWRIVARDTAGLETSGPVWSFTTSTSTNRPPTVSNPSPPDGSYSSSVSPVLSWTAQDPDNDPLSFFVMVQSNFGDYFFTQTNTPTFAPGPLESGRTYFWHVQVSDGNYSLSGPMWTFTVSGGSIPVLFSRFAAEPSGAGVQVDWELSSDEPMESFTLYRRVRGLGSPVAIATGAVTGNHGSYVDASVEPGKSYEYELVVRAGDGDEFRSQVAMVTVPSLALALHQNVPNPFNPQTTIRYDLPPGGGSQRVRLFIVDLSGKRVRTLVDQVQPGGAQSVVWNGHDDTGNRVSSGVYFYVLDTGKQRLTRKLVLLK